MKKNYVKPGLKPYDMATPNLMAGSVRIRSRIGVSSFHTDENDWETDEESSTGTQKYGFWN